MDSTEYLLTPATILAWFPLVTRPRPPGLPLQIRVAELTTLSVLPMTGTRHDRMSRAAEVFNKAALIASDCGVPDMARDLCHRQRELFDQARPLPAGAVQLALQPVLNVPRQLIREGLGQDAYTMLETLYRAARERTAADIDGHPVDLGTITRTPDDHKTVCALIWTALLADGTRALALAGRWTEAASHAAAHRGIGKRLLDGRQAAILALVQNGQANKASILVEQSTIAEPWELTVQSLLRVLCLRAAGTCTVHHVTTMLANARTLTEEREPCTTVIRTRVGLIALDLAGTTDDPRSRRLRTALIATAAGDAYAARDTLAHHQICQYLTTAQQGSLQTLVRASGLGAGIIPPRLRNELIAAVDRAESALRNELAHTDLG
jgi:hypothetical protein